MGVHTSELLSSDWTKFVESTNKYIGSPIRGIAHKCDLSVAREFRRKQPLSMYVHTGALRADGLTATGGNAGGQRGREERAAMQRKVAGEGAGDKL